MYLVIPPRLEKQFLFLSPLVTTRDLPSLIQILTDSGLSILDIQKVNYEKLAYEGQGLSCLNRNLCLFRVRGSTLLIPVGFVIKVARENLVQSFEGKVEKRLGRALDHLDRTYGDLVYMTRATKEYKIIR